MDQLYYDIGRRVSHLRRLHRMTQEDLAEKLDVSVKHISSVERGLSSFSLEKLILLCDILDCSLDYLIRNKDVQASSCSSEDVFIPRFVLETLSDPAKKEERELLMEYLMLFSRIRGNQS